MCLLHKFFSTRNIHHSKKYKTCWTNDWYPNPFYLTGKAKDVRILFSEFDFLAQFGMKLSPPFVLINQIKKLHFLLLWIQQLSTFIATRAAFRTLLTPIDCWNHNTGTAFLLALSTLRDLLIGFIKVNIAITTKVYLKNNTKTNQ